MAMSGNYWQPPDKEGRYCCNGKATRFHGPRTGFTNEARSCSNLLQMGYRIRVLGQPQDSGMHRLVLAV